MEDQVLKQLLDRYFAGDTTLEEEKQLRAHLRTAELSPEWAPYQTYFRLLDEAAEQRAPLRLRQLPPRAPQRSWWRYLAAAAVLLLVAAAWWRWALPGGTSSLPAPAAQPVAAIDWSKYELETPEEAFRITREALREVASELDRGTTMASAPLEKMGEMGKVIR